MENREIMVIGGGAAGLNAAAMLASEGRSVLLLEARERLGGRMHTTSLGDGGPIVELGAEFIHGPANATWEIVRAAGLNTVEVPDRHLFYNGNGLPMLTSDWEQIEHILGRLNESSNDQSFSAFLEELPDVPPESKALATMYVEGFHAADSARIGVRALQRAEEAAERNGGTSQFRISGGYAQVVDWFSSELARLGVEVCTGSVVNQIRWSPGQVEAVISTPDGTRSEFASAAIITLPLGVLQRVCRFFFHPNLPEKEEIIASLVMGQVTKLHLEFRTRFWVEEHFGFIHAKQEAFPTWWSHDQPNLLTGWAGGSQTERLRVTADDSLHRRGVVTLAKIFQVPEQQVQEQLLRWRGVNWSEDRYASGAYTYTPAGRSDAPELLGSPVAGTLFFAGEATDAEGDQGTVHGALASGRRAALEVLETR